MPLIRRAVAVVAVVIALLGATDAAAVCTTATPVCQFSDLPASCCGATSCTLDGTLTVASGVCDFNFGARNVTLSGTLTVGSNTISIEAGSFMITGSGLLDGHGTSPNPGGNVTIVTSGGQSPAFGIATNVGPRIDLSGFGNGGGGLQVHADGPVSITGGTITAGGLDTASGGGAIGIDTSAGSISLSAPIVANSQVGGAGGFVSLHAATDLTVGDTGKIDVRCGARFGGEIDLSATGTMLLTNGSLLEADAFTDSGSDGGEIDLEAGSIQALGTITATGGGDPTGDAGGSGGTISMQADLGPLVLMHGTQSVTLDGAAGGDGGDLDMTTVSPFDAGGTPSDLSIRAPISSNGVGGVTRPGGGGEIVASSAAGLTVLKSISVAGGGSSTGLVDLFAQRDLVINNTIVGNDPAGGGSLDLGSGHDTQLINIGLISNVRMNGTSLGPGGDITISAGNDLIIAGFALNAAGSGAASPGGSISATAGHNISINRSAVLHTSSDANSTREGGSIDLEAGVGDLAGDLQIDGTITSAGDLAAGQPNPSSIRLTGCQVTISSLGSVDSHGDAGAVNFITARTGIRIDGKLITSTAALGGQNLAIFPKGTAVLGGGQVSPPFAACPGCAKDVCTPSDPTTRNCRNQNAPATCCLMPCPQCGNGGPQPEFPEECDPPGCATNCDTHCRLLRALAPPAPPGCDDGSSCTTDTCDETFGCMNQPKPVGAACDDGTICNGRETCALVGDLVACVSDGALDCDDGNPCTDDPCNPQTGCSHTPLNDVPGQGGCDDRCVERCVSGACTVMNPPNCDDGNPSTNDFCDPATGTCQHTSGVSCVPGDSCSDGNPCTSDVCGAEHVCHNNPVADGTACDNATRCDGRETCKSGTCKPGTPVNCDDGNVCTDDTCAAATGACSNQLITACCHTVADCVDGNNCTADSCVANVCQHDNIPNCCQVTADCNDNDACTTDSCDQSTHTCTHTALPDGPQAGCGDACMTGRCKSGLCVRCSAENPPYCPDCADDGDVCTEDVCDPVAGCMHTQIPGCCHDVSECDDHDACTADACNPGNVCAHDRALDCRACSSDAECDPGDACHAQSVCDTTGVCVGYAAPDCTDGNSRTRDVCVVDGPRQAHCEHPCFPSAVATCDDHDACNGVEGCVPGTGTCIPGSPPDCDDGIDCTDDGCDRTTGCTHTPKPVRCDDGIACTDDGCDATAGCTHTRKTGYDAVGCQLDTMVSAFQQPDPDLKASIRTKVSGLIGKARQKLAAAENAGSGKPARRALAAARAKVKSIGKTVQAALKHHKIGNSLADALIAAATGATQAVQDLQTSLTPG